MRMANTLGASHDLFSELQPRDVFLLHAARPLDVYLCDVAAMFRVDTTLRPFQLILKFLVHCLHHCYIL